MRSILCAIAPSLVLPPVLIVMLQYPVLEHEVHQRAPLHSAYDLARQLDAQIAYVESLNKDLPAPYGAILADYKRLLNAEEFLALSKLSRSPRHLSPAQKALSRFILRRHNLPPDFLTADPVGHIVQRVVAMSLKEQQSSRERNHIVFRHFLDCLKHTPPKSVPTYTSRIGLPPDIEKNGLVFCEDPVPLNREDVRRRIEYQINLLLNDFQETTVMWLKRKDRYGKVVEATLVEEGVPKEFSVLPALESGYDRSAASPSLARGWWQLLKPTVVRSPFGEKELDWSIQVNQFKDERRDLTLSTRSAARYLKWIRSKLSNGDKQAGWLIAAAAYNAGLAEIAFRTVAYKTDCYWDMKLSRETEDYVPRWIALFLIDSHREFYPIDVPKISPIEFETLEGVRLNRDLPLTLLATLTGSSVRFIREINGALRTGTSAFKARIDNREVAHTINLPQGSKDVVRNALRSQGFLKEAP